jgi:hypothetical protein
MKSKQASETFGALPSDGNGVTDESGAVASGSEPRLTPESVRDFTVQQDGSADGRAPQAGRPEATGHRPARRALPVEFQQGVRLPVALRIWGGCTGQGQARANLGENLR